MTQSCCTRLLLLQMNQVNLVLLQAKQAYEPQCLINLQYITSVPVQLVMHYEVWNREVSFVGLSFLYHRICQCVLHNIVMARKEFRRDYIRLAAFVHVFLQYVILQLLLHPRCVCTVGTYYTFEYMLYLPY